MVVGPCDFCQRRAEELQVMRDQLKMEKARTAALIRELRLMRGNGLCPDGAAADAWPPRHEFDSIRGGVGLVLPTAAEFRASAAFPYRYVPPTDFLPEEFVRQFSDVLLVVDGYAQEFHRYHVGGARTNFHVDRTVQDAEFLRSRVALLEAQVKSLTQPTGGRNTAPNFTASGHSGSEADDEPRHATRISTSRRRQATPRRSPSPVDRKQDEKQRRLEEWRRQRALAAPAATQLLRPPGVNEAWRAIINDFRT
jgi:hypothetical protein